MLARMEREGSLTARITLKADIRALVPVAGQEVQAWLPLPAACPQQSNIELLDCTPAGWPRRSMHHSAPCGGKQTAWGSSPSPTVTSSGRSTRLPCPSLWSWRSRTLTWRSSRPTSSLPLPAGAGGPADRGVRQPGGKGEGHLRLRHRTGGLPLSARLPPAGLHRRPVRQDPPGDCGVFALLFITLCRIAGIPARWQSGLAVRPGRVGPTTGPCSTWPPRLAVGGLLLRLLRPPQRGGRPPGPLLRQPGPLADGSQFRLPGPLTPPCPPGGKTPTTTSAAS